MTAKELKQYALLMVCEPEYGMNHNISDLLDYQAHLYYALEDKFLLKTNGRRMMVWGN